MGDILNEGGKQKEEELTGACILSTANDVHQMDPNDA